MRIAAFDLGSTSAAAWDTGVDHVDLNPFRTKPKKTYRRPQILRGFTGWVERLLYVHSGIETVVFERPFVRGQAATRMLWGMAGVLEAEATAAGMAVLDMTPSEIKKWATGKGSAGKPEMLVAARRLGYTGDNEHEADAYCLLKFAEATLTKEPSHV